VPINGWRHRPRGCSSRAGYAPAYVAGVVVDVTRQRRFDGTNFKRHKLPDCRFAACARREAAVPPPHLHDASVALAHFAGDRVHTTCPGGRCQGYPGDRAGRCVGRFLPFAIYSQMDSSQECQSDEKYVETKSLFLPETIRGYTFDTNIHTLFRLACRKASAVLRSYGNALAELLSEPDEKSFGAADVAESIRVLVLNHFADELRAALA
jgi:hypothetical protein